jgi:hypothetical protein
VRQHDFLSQWYIRHSLRTYLASRLPLSPNIINKLPLEPHHQGVSSGASKTISDPIVRSVQNVHLYYTDTNTVNKRIETRFHMTHSPRSYIGCVQHDFRADGIFDTNHAPFLRHDNHYIQTDSNKLPLETHGLGVSSGAS